MFQKCVRRTSAGAIKIKLRCSGGGDGRAMGEKLCFVAHPKIRCNTIRFNAIAQIYRKKNVYVLPRMCSYIIHSNTRMSCFYFIFDTKCERKTYTFAYRGCRNEREHARRRKRDGCRVYMSVVVVAEAATAANGVSRR